MGRVGATELGTVGVTSALFLAASTLLRGTVGSVMVVVSQAFGAEDQKGISRAFQHYMVFGYAAGSFRLYHRFSLRCSLGQNRKLTWGYWL